MIYHITCVLCNLCSSVPLTIFVFEPDSGAHLHPHLNVVFLFSEPSLQASRTLSHARKYTVWLFTM